jgi:hypothetical protein
MAKRTGRGTRRPAALAFLDADGVRRVVVADRTLYILPDLLTQLTGAEHPLDYWAGIARRDAALAKLVEHVPVNAAGQEEEIAPAVDLAGVLRIIQSLQHPRAEPIKRWLAAGAVEHLEEAENPELAVARARREYEQHGYPRQWIDQRLRSVSARADVVGEWHRRGAQGSDDYRALTNDLVQEAFGMDVETYRQHKGLFGRENLRDHMSEMELALLSLGETVAAALHRSRGSATLADLERDMHAAGRVVADARQKIEAESGRDVVEGQRLSWAERRNPRDGRANADGGREVLYRRTPRAGQVGKSSPPPPES